MPKEPSWKVDVKSLSHQALVDLLKQLNASKHREVIESLRRELIDRSRTRGLSNQEIIKLIALGIPRGRRLNELAKTWAEILGVSVEEFRRIADAK